MTGGPDSWSLEVQWDGSTWTDETAALKARESSEVTIRRGRGSTADDVQTGVLSGVFDNTGGTYTPDNALSPRWPYNAAGNAPSRFAVTIGGVSSDRHRGRATLGQPQWPRGQASEAVVPFESVGQLGQVSLGPLTCDFVERHRYSGRTGLTVDVWPLDEVPDGTASTPLRNVGNGSGPGRVVPATTRVGTAAQETPEGIDLESSIVLSPRDGVGPVLQLETSIPSGSVLGLVIPFRTADRTAAGGSSKYIARGIRADGGVEWSVRLVDNGGQCDVNVYDRTDSFVATLYLGFAAVGAAAGDDQWFSLVWQYSGGLSFLRLLRASDNEVVTQLSIAVATVDLRVTDTVILGGLGGGKRLPGKQVQCTAARFGAVAVTTSAGSVHDTYLRINAPSTLTARVQDMSLYREYPMAVSGSREVTILQTQLAGRDPLEVLAELCRTTGAVVVESRSTDSQLVLLRPDTQRREAVALEVSIADDVDGSNGFPTRKGGTPSVVTATWPGGRVVYSDPTRPVVAGSVDTCAASAAAAESVASARVLAGRRLRIESLRIDLAGSASALWPTLKDLEIGARIRVQLGTAGSPFVTQFGRTFVDVYAVGWVEHYAEGVAWWEIDTEPADDPPYAVTDSTSVRVCAAPGAMTVTPGTLSGTAGLGTIVVTTLSGPTLSTDASDYPADFNVGGERMTVSSAPASSASPQTLTVTARGVEPSVGKVHGSGESFDVWLRAAAAW